MAMRHAVSNRAAVQTLDRRWTARGDPSLCSSKRTDLQILAVTVMQAGPTRFVQAVAPSRSHCFHFAFSGRSPGFVVYLILTYPCSSTCEETRVPLFHISSRLAVTLTSTLLPTDVYGAEYQLFRYATWQLDCSLRSYDHSFGSNRAGGIEMRCSPSISANMESVLQSRFWNGVALYETSQERLASYNSCSEWNARSRITPTGAMVTCHAVFFAMALSFDRWILFGCKAVEYWYANARYRSLDTTSP